MLQWSLLNGLTVLPQDKWNTHIATRGYTLFHSNQLREILATVINWRYLMFLYCIGKKNQQHLFHEFFFFKRRGEKFRRLFLDPEDYYFCYKIRDIIEYLVNNDY